MLGLIILLAKFFYGLSIDDDQLIISIHDICLVVLMPIDRHGVKVKIRNPFS